MSDRGDEQAAQPKAEGGSDTVPRQDLQPAGTETQQGQQGEGRFRDTRKIRRGVVFHEGDALRTYGDTPEDLDALERLMSPEQCARLRARGAISGNWQPKGKGPPPMPQSPRGENPVGRRSAGFREDARPADALRADYDRLASENADMRRRLEELERKATAQQQPQQQPEEPTAEDVPEAQPVEEEEMGFRRRRK
jgi:hypothetical protein